jgi:deoxycytidylate deaminase
VRAVHAEANAIVQGALHGVGLERRDRVHNAPALRSTAAKLMISAGVARIVYGDRRTSDPFAQMLLGEARRGAGSASRRLR